MDQYHNGLQRAFYLDHDTYTIHLRPTLETIIAGRDVDDVSVNTLYVLRCLTIDGEFFYTFQRASDGNEVYLGMDQMLTLPERVMDRQYRTRTRQRIRSTRDITREMIYNFFAENQELYVRWMIHLPNNIRETYRDEIEQMDGQFQTLQ
jgi:hypothetical protein